jgi:uncharacterized protein
MSVPLFASAPNRGKFEALFEEGGRNLEEATGRLERLMRGWPDEPELRDEIKLLEEKGDRITHDILHSLYSTKVTPLDREDIHALASALDDALDLTEEAADFLGLYKIEAPMEQAVELAGVLRDCGRELASALARLTALDGLAPHIEAVDELEDEGDRISRRALAALFAGGIDPMVVIRWKDVIDRLEQAVDACDRVAHVLEGIAVKHN